MIGDGAPRQKKFGYVPALDGVRALAVVAVICFHAGFGGVTGGFIGVSVFFTLSGFLITSLLITEHLHSGGISLKGFYSRRLRRLMPASYLCIALVLLSLPFWDESQRRSLPGDALAAVLNVANWRSAFSTVSYQELLNTVPSPLAHFWSLAIEEQCYLVLPLIVAVALRRGRSTLAVTAMVLLGASVAAAVLTSDFDLAYNGTHVRIAEVLVGVLLSVVLTYRRPSGAIVGAVGAAGLAALVAGSLMLEITDEWLAHGGLVLVSVASCAVVVGAIAGGPLASALSWGPLVAIGKVSYGMYLFHWPLFLILTEDRTGLGHWPLFAVRMAALGALSAVSFRLLERPVRTRHLFQRPAAASGAFAIGMAVLLVGIWALPGPRLSATEQLVHDSEGGPVTFAPQSTVPPPPPTLLVVGDNAAALDLLAAGDLGAPVTSRLTPDCPLLSGIEVRLADGTAQAIDHCRPSADVWLEAVAETQPDLVLVAMGALDEGFVRATAADVFPTNPSEAKVAFTAARTEFGEMFAALATQRLPVLVYWPVRVDADTFKLSGFLLGAPGVEGVVTAESTLVPRVEALLSVTVAAGAPHVLVVGDSMSLPFAAALDRAAAGSVVVQWAGQEGCPFVRNTAYRASINDNQPFHEWTEPENCWNFETDLPPLLASFQPDLVLVVANGTELTQQRYHGDPTPYLPGSDGYQRYHDSEMEVFIRTLGPDTPVLVADSPQLRDNGWGESGAGDPERVAAWNAQVARWIAQHPQVRLLSFGAAVVDYEAVHGTIRKDGMHPEVIPLADMLRGTLLPEMLQLLDTEG
ncbi:MAG: acyltransferase [Actinomycetota bacterium]|nr:acyltransferase [Actinomycetota bacterium]